MGRGKRIIFLRGKMRKRNKLIAYRIFLTGSILLLLLLWFCQARQVKFKKDAKCKCRKETPLMDMRDNVFGFGKTTLMADKKPFAEGGQGKVFHAYWVEKKTCVALKVVDMKKLSSGLRGMFDKEMTFMERIRKKNLKRSVMVYEHHEVNDDDEDSVYIIMELGKRSLKKHYKDFVLPRKSKNPEKFNRLVEKILIRILEAFEELHAARILHLDFKLDNAVVFDGNICKLIDFGAAEMMDKKRSDGQLCATRKFSFGTDYYISPEHVNCRKNGGKLTYAADIWAVGVFVYKMLFDKNPILGSHYYDKVAQLDFAIELYDNGTKLNRHLLDVIRASMDPDPEGRPTSTKLLAFLNGTNSNTELSFPKFYGLDARSKKTALDRAMGEMERKIVVKLKKKREVEEKRKQRIEEERRKRKEREEREKRRREEEERRKQNAQRNGGQMWNGYRRM